MTHLCVPIFVTDLAKARREIAAAAAAGADLVELRIDKLRDINTLMLLLDDRILPAIVTCRSELEGGFSQLDDDQRMSQLASALDRGAQLVDLELQTVAKTIQLPAAISGHLILSTHDFSGRPRQLEKMAAQMNATPAKVNKIVWRAENILDNIEAFKLLTHSSRPTVALCMGETGLISRVLARKFGAYLTFAALGQELATAPGQIPIAEMKNLYRWDDIGPATKVFGVVAHPVRHSMSPAIHNAAFTAMGYDGVYLPMLVEPGYASFKTFMDQFLAFRELDLTGLSVTIPHKENALRYLKENGGEIEQLAERIGAVNTIAIRISPDSSAKLSGRNTDYAAILDSITSELAIDRGKLKDMRVAVLGAGGTARAAVAALAHYGADVTISNRTQQRAQALAEEFGISAVSLDELLGGDFQVLINTTSVGMFPNRRWATGRRGSRATRWFSTRFTTRSKRVCSRKPRALEPGRSAAWRCSCARRQRNSRPGLTRPRRSRSCVR